MATTLTLRRRIKTAQNIAKTTRAMQMIAASKLKRAQDAAISSRPYVNQLNDITLRLQPLLKKDKDSKKLLHPYLRQDMHTGKTLYIVIAPDKGSVGGLITNIIREYLKYNTNTAYFVTIGKKIENPVASTTPNLIASFPFGLSIPPFYAVTPIIQIIEDYFLNKKVDQVKIITTHFTSVFSQTPKIRPLLPIVWDEQTNEQMLSFKLFEPAPEAMLPALLKRYIEMNMYQYLLESFASEQAARMLAMQNATNNAKDLGRELKLLYNKARQEKITNEILDISSAAVALEEK